MAESPGNFVFGDQCADTSGFSKQSYMALLETDLDAAEKHAELADKPLKWYWSMLAGLARQAAGESEEAAAHFTASLSQLKSARDDNVIYAKVIGGDFSKTDATAVRLKKKIH